MIKTKKTLILKGIFLKLHICMYLSAKFEVSNIILTSFRKSTKISFKRDLQKEKISSSKDMISVCMETLAFKCSP